MVRQGIETGFVKANTHNEVLEVESVLLIWPSSRILFIF